MNKALLSGLIVLLLLACYPFNTVQAQDSGINFSEVRDQSNYGRFRLIEVRGHTGTHLYSGEGLDDKLDSGYGSVEVRYGWQFSDPDGWGSRYGYPSYGVGIYSGWVGDPQVFGNPNAVYGWINFPIDGPGYRNVFSINTAFGLTYNLEPFDPVNNPLNDAIGANMAVYFDMSFEFAYRLTREMDLIYGLDLAHFSNGRSFTPNWGLNMFGLVLGMRYHYNADQRKVNNDPYTDQLLQARFKRSVSAKPERVGRNFIDVLTAIGTVQNDEDAGTDTRYVTFSGVIDYRYQFNNMHAATAGIDYFYDGSLEEYYPGDSSARSLVGLHLGYDYMFWRFAVRLQVGAYITDDRGKDPMYLRPALRYQINNWMHAQVGLKTRQGAAADWIEWGISFTPFSW